MTTVRWILVAAIAAAVLFLIAALALTADRSSDPMGENKRDEASAPYRIVGSFQGHVAVFLPDAREPEQVYDTMVASLPAQEREKLETGISVANSRELKRLLEDYLS